MQNVYREFNISIDSVLKISHLGLTKAFLSSFDLSEDVTNQVLNLLDNYYKADHKTFEEKLSSVAPKNAVDAINKLIKAKDISLMKEYAGYEDMAAILE